jgi:hypothetical protein
MLSICSSGFDDCPTETRPLSLYKYHNDVNIFNIV